MGVSYSGPSSHPDWEATVISLVDILEEVLDDIYTEARDGTRADIIAMNALDSLNQYLDRIKMDLGV